MPNLFDLFSALAKAMRSPLPFDAVVTSDAAAIALFMRFAHDNRCPGCRQEEWAAERLWHVRCRRCGVVPMYRGSELGPRRISARNLLAAVYAVYVDARTHSARGFSRERRLRLDTAYRLLDLVRTSLPLLVPNERGARAQVLGREDEENAADAVVSFCSEAMTAVGPGEACPAGPRRREVSINLGLLRAWLTTTFRGVTKEKLQNYLCEFAARHGRVERANVLHV